MAKYVTRLVPSQNKNLSRQHCFFLFETIFIEILQIQNYNYKEKYYSVYHIF